MSAQSPLQLSTTLFSSACMIRSLKSTTQVTFQDIYRDAPAYIEHHASIETGANAHRQTLRQTCILCHQHDQDCECLPLSQPTGLALCRSDYLFNWCNTYEPLATWTSLKKLCLPSLCTTFLICRKLTHSKLSCAATVRLRKARTRQSQDTQNWQTKIAVSRAKKDFTSFGQPTRLITCANHGNNVICS